MESVSPLHGAAKSEWRDVYVEVRGTMLNFHRVKDGRPSRILRSYTLQHAEIGLAPDVFHTVLAPNSKLAHLIPSAARQKAFRKDPQLFRAEEQFIMRLRVETDQILLAHKSEDKILEMIHEIGAGIDLAPAIDERNISKQCTVPRRRRRPNTQTTTDINNAAVVAEQERILQQMYPSFAQGSAEQNEPSTTSASTTPNTTPLGTPTREEDELDLSAIREDFSEGNALTQTTTSTSTTSASNSERPTYSRTVTATSIASAYETAPTNFGPEGKWQPPHLRTAAQIRRYVRRCAPLLMSDAVRASDIVICNGKRMRINWRQERLEEWLLRPPTYDAHDFAKEQQKKEDTSTVASAAAVNPADSVSGNNNELASPRVPSSLFSESSADSSHDDITPLEERSEQTGGLAHLDLVKTSSAGSAKGNTDKPTATRSAVAADASANKQKAREVQRDNSVADAQSILFCF